MSLQRLQGLSGLPGLNHLDQYQRKAFFEANKSILNTDNFKRLRDLDKAAEILYNNQLFVKKFGQDVFNQYNNGTEEAYNMRNEILKNTVVEEVWNNYTSPFKADGTRDNNLGLGALWEKYNEMSTDAKLKALESGWLNNQDFAKKLEDYKNETLMTSEEAEKADEIYDSWWAKLARANAGPVGANLPDQHDTRPYSKKYNSMVEGHLNAYNEAAKHDNEKTLEDIYNDDLKDKTYKLSSAVAQAYLSPDISSKSDDEIERMFHLGFLNDDSDMVKYGGGVLAAYWGSNELKDLTVDDMRKWLAKKNAYMANMSPGSAVTALNNEAREYVTDHQSTLKRGALFANDLVISAISYTIDKADGIYSLALMAQDKSGDMPTVWVDDLGNVVDPKTSFYRDSKGQYRYKDNNDEERTVHQTQVSRMALHNMGKNFDGSDNDGIFNPLYWSRAEQFGTLDADEQKQYERLGASPYKVSYNPNDDTDYWYEAFKMASFGIADTVAMLIPFGVGAVGKSLQTASAVGKAAYRLGQGLNFIGKIGTNPMLQGSAGAIGIANAYSRGAFQETLAQNLSNAEEMLSARALNEVRNEYNNNAEYKAAVDAEAAERAKSIKAQYITELLASNSNAQILDEAKIDEMCLAQAREEYIGELIQQRMGEMRQRGDWAQLQDEAINKAGETAVNVFLPEATKYAFVNGLGPRKWIYTNPTGLTRKMSSAFKGLREMTTKGGLKRMTTEASQFLTRKQKLGQFALTSTNQIWGGLWTNGSDDMMVDAAEQINEDSYGRYLNGYLHDEAVADTWSFIDSMHSYFTGFTKSWGQETTWDAALIGGLGVMVSGNINFTNLAHLATAEGRAAYRNNFQQRYKRNEDGTLAKDENGQPIVEKIGWRENWRDRAAYFIQNGILNTYYGKKQAERDLQSHADYVNNLLDQYNDFEDIHNLVASSKLVAANDLEGKDDDAAKVLKAIYAINALNNLGNSSSDPASMSSVIQETKSLIDNLAEMEFDPEKQNLPEGEQIQNLLSQYYANNPSIAQNASTAMQGLATMISNAKSLKEIEGQYTNAEREIQRAEASTGTSIPRAVRERLKISRVLNNTWETRLGELKESIGDSSVEGEVSLSDLIATVGGKTNAQQLMKVYARQDKELNQDREAQEKVVAEKKKVYDDAVKKLRRNTDNSAQYDLQKKVEKASAEYDNAKQQLHAINQDIALSQRKSTQLTEALKATEVEGYKDKVLTADEILALDPITRARMLRYIPVALDANNQISKTTRDLYSKEQIAEIEKAEQQLLMKDPNALNIIQDIALYTQRLKTNKDSYVKMLKHPEAAAISLEHQRAAAVESAFGLIQQRSAQTIADIVTNIDRATAPHKEITQAEKDAWVYKNLRGISSEVLDIVDNEGMIPKYQKQLDDAKDWVKVLDDIDAIISKADKGDAWEDNTRRNLDAIIDDATTMDELLTNMEKAINDINNSLVTADFEYVLKGLEKMEYQRAATILGNVKERREKAEAERKRIIEEEKAAIEAAKAAASQSEAQAAEAAQAAAEAEAKAQADAVAQAEAAAWATESNEAANAQTEHPVSADGEGLKPAVSAEDAKAEHHVDEKSVEDESKRQDVDLWGEGTEEGKAEGSEKSTAYPSQIVEREDEVLVQSPDLKDQVTDSENSSVHNSDSSESSDSANVEGERMEEFKDNTFSGNAMHEYETGEIIVKDGILKRRKGARPDDHMNKFFAWMENAGIHLQNIIDHELAQILENNPHMKIKFMTVKKAYNATHDNDVATDTFLVVDYDNSINKNITNTHNRDNGGVIESNGKKYLIVGVLGWGKGGKESPKFPLYDILHNNRYGLLFTSARGKHFKEHPEDRFYVAENVETEIVPRSLIPGYIIKQLETDEHPKYRSITELLADDNRNPQGLTLDDLSWGIQEAGQFLIVGTTLDKVMVPRDSEANRGSAFVLIPAANGKLVASYLKPLFYTEMKDGSLKDKVNQLLTEVLSLDYQRRRKAVVKLSQIFHFDLKGGDCILLRKKTAEISLVHDGEVMSTFVLNSDLDRQSFFDAFSDMNPRVNITGNVFSREARLKEYDEAGALTTDIASLSTAGSSYSIYALDSNGKMIQSETPSNVGPSEGSSSYRNDNRNQVVFKRKYYSRENGTFYLNGIPVTDANTIQQLELNQRVIEGNYEAMKKDGIWEYYIVSEGEHPEVIKINKNTKEAVKTNDEQAKAFVEEFLKKAEDEAREIAAIEALNHPINLEGVSLDDEGMLIIPTEPPIEGAEEAPATEAPAEKEEVKEETKAPTKSVKPSVAKSSTTQSFETLYRSPKQMTAIISLIKSKWKDAPTKSKEAAEYLRKKGIEVDAIGTTQADIDAWIKTIKDCR